MSFSLDGFVLRAPRVAPSNATTTAPATNGVLRDIRDLPASYDFAASLVEPCADQYRTAVLANPESGTTQEYLIWAANTSSLTVIEDPAWAITAEDPAAATIISTGTLNVTDTSVPTTRTDGASRIIVQDAGSRAIFQVRYLKIRRGDDGLEVEAGPDTGTDFDSQDADAGVVQLSATTLAALGGGVSEARGDTVTEVRYVLAAARFWWTRNDDQAIRFGWNGRTQRWEPYKGSRVKSLGILVDEEDTTLTPRPTRFLPGDTLPGDPSDTDQFALVRIGSRPDSTATVPEILVVADEDVADYSFGATPDGVMGATSGVISWNPAFVASQAGRAIWYAFESFSKDSNGYVGDLLGAGEDPLFITPVPEITDRPFIRLGSRRPLTPRVALTDAELATLTVAEGEVGWSRSSGQLKFSTADLEKADPDAAGFDVHYLGAGVFYDGVSLTSQSVRTREPVQLVSAAGSPTTVGAGNDLYIPAASPLPAPGLSGVLHVPDGTGTRPNASAAPGTRPNGCGLVRAVHGIGDTIIFAPEGALEEVRVVENEEDLPDFPFLIRKGRGYVAKARGTGGSKLALGLKDRGRFGGQPLYFLQAEVLPATYSDTARIISREAEPYTFTGGEALHFAVDGALYSWTASAGTFTAAEVAASIDTTITGTGSATALNGKILLSAGNLDTGTVEIGFGATPTARDFSAASILGFLPGWRVDPSAGLNWLPDSGAGVGLYRSPQNRDRSRAISDFVARGMLDNVLLSEDVPANPFFPLDALPLQDVPGYDENVFFRVVDGLNIRNLTNLESVLYDFANDRIAWLEQGSTAGRLESVTGTVGLGNTGVVADSLHPAVATGNGLYVSTAGGAFSRLSEGVDFLLPAGGAPGQALLIEVVGGRKAVGSNGSFSSGGTTFVDPNATFLADGVTAGYRLKVLSGGAAGSYIVSTAVSETTLEVSADVPFTDTASLAAWEIYEGHPDSVYDPAVIADVQYEEFNHLPEEPFAIRVLSSVGTVPASVAAQSAARLTAVASDALRLGREINLRFGLESDGTASLTPLSHVEVGTLSNAGLVIPDTSDPHFIHANFSVLVGSQRYTMGTDLVGVSAFSPALAGDQIEYGLPGSGIEGQLRFGSSTLEDLEGSVVHFFQEFLDPTQLSAGAAEIDTASGDLNLSSADIAAHQGAATYFVEKMITEQRRDVAISPQNGSVFFMRPLRDGQIVEASYTQATTSGAKKLDADGNPITVSEFLPLFVRQEEATRITADVYGFNPTSRTVYEDFDPIVWVGPNRQNYGSTTTATFDFSSGVVNLADDVVDGTPVKVSYAVLEAFGGEQAFSTSLTPVYRPPFFVEANQSEITLLGDRSGDLLPGKMLRLGATPLYIKSAIYDASALTTTVTIWPALDQEVGSRAPGNDLLSLISSVPITTSVDGSVTTASAGFLLTLSASFEPVDKGMLSIVFHGDATQFAIAGHVLEIDGYPFLIVGGTLSDDGLTTRVDVSTPFPKGFDTSATVKISARPIYQPSPRSFLGRAPYVSTADTELVLFGEQDDAGSPLPGRTLVPEIDYVADPATGAIELVAPRQGALKAGQKLLFGYTKQRFIGPFVSNGVVIYPRMAARYAHVVTPSDDNGLAGSVLTARYAFHSPDTFYFRAVPLVSYMGEVAKVATARVAARAPHGGPVVGVGGSTKNYEQGRLGLDAQHSDLYDQDRAARTFISVYNDLIVGFEQVLETVSGEVIGDRDGKFRFFVGRGKDYAPSGYEDPITGRLNPRNVWFDTFRSANGSFTVTAEDPIVDPETATRDPSTLEVEGDPMDPFVFDFYLQEQNALVRNDIDDVVLAGRKRPRLSLGIPFPSFTILGDYRRMGEPHALSRLFPESAHVFSTTYPGLLANLQAGDPGQYAFLKMLEPPKLFKGEGAVFGSTFGKPIASISNPSLGEVQNITDVEARERLPRARVWAYSATGFPELDAAHGTTTAGRPTVIATPLRLKDFPVDSTTGLPVISRLASQGGDLPDLVTGDAELSTPGWQGIDKSEKILPQVAFGRPTGETFGVGLATKKLGAGLFSGAFDIGKSYGGMFVESVQAGCVITFADDGAGAVNSASDILILQEGELEGSKFYLEQGDTIYVVPPGAVDTSSMSDPPTVKELEEFSKNLPIYRRGFDLGVRKRSGNFIDLSLPSFKDPSPFGLMEISGQRPPKPLTAIEANIEFVYTERTPHAFPALAGQSTNDDGDYTIPYLSYANTELDRLGAAARAFTGVIGADSPTPQAIYPDEIVGGDGTILGAASGSTPPATMLTTRDMTPVTTAGSYTANSGIGDVAAFDLLLIESGQAGIAAGSQGILSVGAVSTNQVEPPRFVTPTVRGERIGYIFDNAMSHVSATFSSGVVITESGGQTTFDISSVGGLFLNDGQPGANGGLNHLIPFGSTNTITLRIIANGGTGSPGTQVETIVLSGTGATGDGGTVALASGVTFGPKLITVPAIGFVDFTDLGGSSPAGPFDFTLSIDTTGSGSTTARVHRDRLTFSERIDLSTAPARGATGAGGIGIEAGLRVEQITASGATNITVNSPTEVNGGDAFTFVPRDSSSTEVGSFNAASASGSGNELGVVKVMGFEGHNNTPITTSAPVTFSAIPSSGEYEGGTICSGTANATDGTNSLRGITAGMGAIVPGDVLVIEESGAGNAAVKAGTYLIRHAIPVSNATYGGDIHEVAATATAGAGSGWVEVSFPHVVSITFPTASDGSLVVDGIQEVPTSPSGYNFAASGRLYVIKSAGDLTSAVCVDYSAFSVAADGQVTFTITDSTAVEADGSTALTNAAFAALVEEGDLVSGMAFLPLGRLKGSFPTNNVVGFDHGGTTVGGFTDITVSNTLLAGAGALTFSLAGTTLADATGVTPGAGDLGLTVSGAGITAASTSFLSDIRTPVYDDVPLFLDLRGLTATEWNTIHGAAAPGVTAIVPGDTLAAMTSAGDPGFRGQAGIFLEPSWPRPTTNLADGNVKVVDAAHTLAAASVGMRNASDFGFGAFPQTEAVNFEVRRIRRFHDVLVSVADNIQPLRFAYEIRRGTVTSYSYPVLTAAGGTQLGLFDDEDVNVNAGDEVRLLDADGSVIDTATIGAVLPGGEDLLIAPPGFSVSVSAGQRFEVFLRRAPVPHEQSNTQLLDMITERVLVRKVADPTNGEGGRVSTVNIMDDPSVVDFSALGIQEGDIVIVDPAGALAGPTGAASPAEKGSRPIGDQAVVGRAPHIAGGPSDLDDNRGWYRVLAATTILEVTGETVFTGPDGADVVFGGPGQEYVVYPAISASGLTGTTEGQMDLRPTAPADGSNSYKGNSYSIEPFSYQIIRPVSFLSAEAVDLVLMNRERMLSWLELLDGTSGGEKSGSYYVFQRDEHVSDLGSATDPSAGLGVPGNLLITTLSGLVSVAPFANTSDCLSILDRRYWVLDTRLDREVPPHSGGAIPYASFEGDALAAGLQPGSGRPVLPDRIEDVLDRADRLRALRFSWIKFRTDRIDGTLPAIKRFADELPRLIEEQEDLLRLQEGLDT